MIEVHHASELFVQRRIGHKMIMMHIDCTKKYNFSGSNNMQ